MLINASPYYPNKRASINLWFCSWALEVHVDSSCRSPRCLSHSHSIIFLFANFFEYLQNAGHGLMSGRIDTVRRTPNGHTHQRGWNKEDRKCKCWWGPETTRTLPHCGKVCVFSQPPLKKTTCQDLLGDHKHSLGPGIFLEMGTYEHQETHTRTLIVAPAERHPNVQQLVNR